MKKAPLFIAVAVGALAVAGVLRSQTTNSGTGSSATSGQNPSGTTSGQNPSQTVPGQNPSQTTTPPTLPNPSLPTASGTAGDVLTPEGANGTGTVTDRVRTAVIQSAPTSSGVPSTSAPGISVNDFRVTSGADGKVTLRGVVHSEKERSDAEERAAQVVGRGNVINQLTVR